MFLVTTYSSGNQVWHCPICNRRIMFAVEPADLIIIETGDNSVSHYGSNGGLNVVSIKCDDGNFGT